MPVRSRLNLALMLALTATTAHADDAADIADLRDRLRQLEARLGQSAPDPDARNALGDLDQRLRILERKLEIQQEDAVAKATTIPVVAINDKGLSIKNQKGDFELKLRGGLQFDHRAFFNDTPAVNDSFLFRRIRPSLEGSLGSLVGFRITPELAEDSTSLIDAYIDVKFDPRASLRVGKIKGPVGLERLASWNALAMIERGFPTELAPSRELGAQVFGELAKGEITYAVGAFNGAPDGRNANANDVDNNTEFEGRVFFEPWKNDANALSGLGFGIVATVGEKDGTGNSLLPRYRTSGQQVFFNYRAAVSAAGEHRRLSPQAYYYRNALGLQAEYIRSEQELLLPNAANSRIDLKHGAWQVTGSYVLTGEDAGYKGIVKPNEPFEIGGPGWGAFELVTRYGELDVDDDAFPRYADPALAASQARALGVGLNWLLTSNLKLQFNLTQTQFDGGAANGADRPDENAFFSRVQVAF